MKKIALTSLALASVMLLVLPSQVLAKTGGCVDSPEEPTLALGLIGVAAYAATYLKSRFTRK